MHALTHFFTWVLQASWQASILILLVLLAHGLFGRWLTARGRAVLWLLVITRLLLPVSPGSVVSLFNFAKPEAAAPVVARWFSQEDRHERMPDVLSTDIEVPASSAPSARLASPPPAPRPVRAEPRLWLWTTGLWALSGLVLGVRLLWRNGRFGWQLQRCRKVTDRELLEVLAACQTVMAVRGRLRLVETDLVSSPALYGLLRCRLLLPVMMARRLTREEWRFVFLHELAHLKRWDVLINWLMSLLKILHWFNPVVGYAFRRIRQDRELACDELVLAKAQPQENQAYGEAILKVLEYGACPAHLPGLVGIMETRVQIERRIRMIAKFNMNARSSVLVLVLLAILGVMTLTDAQKRPPGGKPTLPPPDKISVPVTMDGDTFVDSKTGIRFTKAKSLSGPTDVITSNTGLRLSPNGKFLLWGGGVKVVPLDGSKSFDLVDNPKAAHGVWSPNGRLVAFNAGAIWVVPVNPETAQPTGPARKLIEGDYWYQGGVEWVPDSERIVFRRLDQQSSGGFWTISVTDGSLAQVTDFSIAGKQSSDGKYTAYNRGGVWVKPVASGEARKIADNGRPIVWSTGDEWLLMIGDSFKELRLVRLTDNREVKLELPDIIGGFLDVSSDRKKLYFYRPSYGWHHSLRVVSVSGGPACELGSSMRIFPYDQFWSPDGKKIITVADDDYNLWAFPLSALKPTLMKIDPPAPGEIWGGQQLSPDCKYLLVSLKRDDKTRDLWVAPFSWEAMRTTGQFRLLFNNWEVIPLGGNLVPGIWSPDSKKIAIMQQQKGEIWIAGVEGGDPVQLAPGPGLKGWPVWSPDGKMIAFHATYSATNHVVQVISASGGEAKTVTLISSPVGRYTSGRFRPVVWSPDGKALTIADGDTISSWPVPDGNPRPLVKLKDIGRDEASELCWSPDGKILAFRGKKTRDTVHIFLFHSESGHLESISEKDPYCYHWSPDGKWISYWYEISVKERPEGVLWEMDVDEVVAKLSK